MGIKMCNNFLWWGLKYILMNSLAFNESFNGHPSHGFIHSVRAAFRAPNGWDTLATLGRQLITLLNVPDFNDSTTLTFVCPQKSIFKLASAPFRRCTS